MNFTPKEEFILTSLQSLIEFFAEADLYASCSQIRISNDRIENHVTTDWGDDKTLMKIGLTPIRPVMILTIPSNCIPTRNSVEFFVLCEEGMISVKEIQLAEKQEDLIPSQEEIARRCEIVRKNRKFSPDSRMPLSARF